MPNFNSEKTILSSLISVKNQTYKNFECIIVDDYSSDNSVNLIEEFISNDRRFKLINSNRNYGVSISRNIAISNSRGRYITFLDSDDIWDERFLENNFVIRRKKDIPISHSNYVRFKISSSSNSTT